MHADDSVTAKRMQEAVDFLYAIPKFTKKNPLAHTEEFMERLGNPQDSLKVIHVAGSNGKGSVCSFLFSILRECGCSVGMFTSPHLVDIRERFMITGGAAGKEDFSDGMVSEEVFLQVYDEVLKTAEQMREEGGNFPTFFEFLFAMGMLIFQKSGVEYAIFETGMGGRLDATNVVKKPLVCVITSVSLEHMEYLGDTIEKIAFEKAGIIKPGVPVVYDGNVKEVAEVIKNRAEELGSDSYEITKNMCNFHETIGGGIDFSFASLYDKKTDFHLPFSAPYQVMNAALAITAFYRIAGTVLQGNSTGSACGFDENAVDQIVKTGIAKAVWPGRMQKIMPEVYFDGAHNPDGIRAFLAAADLLTRGDEEKPLLLFSMVRDKDYRQALHEILTDGYWEEICVTGIPSERGLTVDELEAVLEEEKDDTPFCGVKDYKEAFRQMLGKKKDGQKLFVTGSLYFIGALLKEIQDAEL